MNKAAMTWSTLNGSAAANQCGIPKGCRSKVGSSAAGCMPCIGRFTPPSSPVLQCSAFTCHCPQETQLQGAIRQEASRVDGVKERRMREAGEWA